jgi:hypothetical protein
MISFIIFCNSGMGGCVQLDATVSAASNEMTHACTAGAAQFLICTF